MLMTMGLRRLKRVLTGSDERRAVALCSSALMAIVGVRPAFLWAEPFYAGMQQFVREWFLTVLMFLGLVTPAPVPMAATAQLPRPKVIHRRHLPKAVAALPQSILKAMHLQSMKKSYTYVFEGRVVFQGLPPSSVPVQVRMVLPEGEITRRVAIHKDGSYSIPVVLKAALGQPIDWTLEASIPGLAEDELQGRAIAADEQEVTITVQDALELASAQ